MKKIVLIILAWWFLFSVQTFGGDSQTTPMYFLAGQGHPQYEITLHINSKEIKTVRSNSGKMKLFIKQFDAEHVHPGANQLKVTYRKRSDASGEGLGPSFKVTLKYQTDPMDKKTAKVLAKLRGPKPPFTNSPESGKLTKEFESPQ